MTDTLTQQDIWNQVNIVKCQMCETARNADLQNLGMLIRSDGDLEDAYEFMDCCGDPFLVALAVVSKPIFNDPIDEAYHIHENPAAGVYADRWEYEVGDDLFITLKREGLITS